MSGMRLRYKKIICRIIDVGMAMLILFSMAYRITGNAIHEWMGVATFILYAIHNLLNRRWYQSLFKGRWTLARMLHTAINLLLLVSVSVVMASAVFVSQTVFPFLSGQGFLEAREIHSAAAYWSYLFLSMHLGVHGGMVVSEIRKKCRGQRQERIWYVLGRTALVLCSLYGIRAFLEHEFLGRLVVHYTAGFWMFNTPLLQFLLDYLAVMALFAGMSYYGCKGCSKVKIKSKQGR